MSLCDVAWRYLSDSICPRKCYCIRHSYSEFPFAKLSIRRPVSTSSFILPYLNLIFGLRAESSLPPTNTHVQWGVAASSAPLGQTQFVNWIVRDWTVADLARQPVRRLALFGAGTALPPPAPRHATFRQCNVIFGGNSLRCFGHMHTCCPFWIGQEEKILRQRCEERGTFKYEYNRDQQYS